MSCVRSKACVKIVHQLPRPYNFITISIAFIIGAINTLFLYPTYPGKEFQGLVVALLATSNLLQPFISFGVQHALIKFYSSYSNKQDRDNLLWFSIYFPIIIIIALLCCMLGL